MPHWQRCASEDAEVRSRPLGITKFIDCKTGICRLCGHGLGKRFTRDWRKFHEGDTQHHAAYARYTAEFTRLVEERLIAQWEHAQRETVRRQDADIVASIRGYDVMRWLRHGDESTMAVKAALFDVILGIDADGDKGCAAIERHEAAERRRLVYLVAASALPNDVAGAWTAARLCALHI